MKTFFILILCAILSVAAYGQQKSEMVDEVQVTPPKFTGSEEAVAILQGEKSESISDYLAKNVIYPEKAIKSMKEGTEVIQFIVSSSGEVSDFNVINSVSPEIDSEVIRALKTTNGMWLPGYNNGTPVAMNKEVSVTFKWGKFEDEAESKDFVAMAKSNFNKANKRFFIKRNPKKALKYYANSIRYLPNDACLLITRGLCRYELGDADGAHEDWARLKDLGKIDIGNKYLASNAHQLKGYEELTDILGK